MEVEVRTHIEYLAGQDITHAKAFCQKSLQGFTAPTPLVVARTILKNELIKAEYQEQAINLPKTLVSALELLARLHNLTINTLGTPLFESLLVLSDAPIATEAKD